MLIDDLMLDETSMDDFDAKNLIEKLELPFNELSEDTSQQYAYRIRLYSNTIFN